jgi:hypothetical protein
MRTFKLLFTFSMLALVVSFQSCFYHYHDDNWMIRGSGPIVEEEFTLDSFDAVVTKTVIDVEIVQGDEQVILVEGHENMMDYIELRVSRGTLYIGLKPGSYSNFKLKVFLTMPAITSVSTESTGNIEIGEFNNIESLSVNVRSTGNVTSNGWLAVANLLDIKTGSTGKVTLNIDVDEVKTKVNGTGNVNLTGSCTRQSVELNSTGNYNAYELVSDICDVRTNSVGDAKVFVNESLDAYICSVGNIFYKGNPEIYVNDRGVGDLIAVRN